MSGCLFPWVTLNFPWLLWSAYLVLPQMPILTYSSLAFHVSTVNISHWTYGYLSRARMWTFGGLLTSPFHWNLFWALIWAERTKYKLALGTEMPGWSWWKIYCRVFRIAEFCYGIIIAFPTEMQWFIT